MDAIKLKSGRWHGQLTNYAGVNVPVTLAIEVSDGGRISGEYWAYTQAGEFNGKFSGRQQDRFVQLASEDETSKYDALLHDADGGQVLTGYATFGGTSGPLVMRSTLQLASPAWDESDDEGDEH